MPKDRIDYVVYIHRLYSNDVPKLGGLDYVVDYLIAHGSKVLVIESPLYPADYNKITIKLRSSSLEKTAHVITIPFKIDYLAWGLGAFLDIFFTLIYVMRGSKVISSDPLSSFPAVVMRKIGYFNYHYYHCTDYSEQRFNSSLVNRIYRFLLAFSIKNADLVGCVSKRILNVVQKFDHKELIYIPNSPEFTKFTKFRKHISERDKNKLVLTCAGLSERYKVLETIQLVYELSHEFKDINLQLVGKTDLDTKYFNKVLDLIDSYNFSKHVDIVGYVTRDESWEIISNSYIGLAFYNSHDTYSWYSDPLKIREYAALGLPCVADLITSAAEEMRDNNAGFAVENIPAAYAKIKQLLNDDILYKTYSDNALKWAKELDKEVLLKTLVTNYLEK